MFINYKNDIRYTNFKVKKKRLYKRTCSNIF